MKPLRSRLPASIGVFAAVVDAGTFAAAAELMEMSPPGVSKAIARLEKQLGVRLFSRTTRTVTLTEDGRRFHERVMPHLRGMEEAAETAAGSLAQVRGRLRINLDPVTSQLLLGPNLAGFMDAHGALALELIARDHLGDLVTEGFDLALRFGEPHASSLVARKLLETSVVTVASPGYLARCGRPDHPQELVPGKHVCLEFRNPLTGKPYPWEFHRSDRKLVVDTQGRLTVNDPGALVHACVSGSGVAQMLSIVAEPLLRAGQLVNLFPDWMDERFPLYVYYPSRHHVPAKTRAFLDFVAATLGAGS